MCFATIKTRICIILAIEKWWLFPTSNCILIGDENGQRFPEESLTLHMTILEAI